jgi:hypothetical protein
MGRIIRHRVARGLFRLWVVLTVIWAAPIVGFTFFHNVPTLLKPIPPRPAGEEPSKKTDRPGSDDFDIKMKILEDSMARTEAGSPPETDPWQEWRKAVSNRDGAIVSIGFFTGLAVLPPLLALILGLAFFWVAKGFA